MKKLLFIAPHLSTGGQPQYLLKKIKALNEKYEIHCVEYNDHTGGVLIVQREQIQKICNYRFYVLNDNKEELIQIIKDINPDLIHFEEMPEYFMDMNLAFKIYNNERTYKIIETSHDSSFNSSSKRVFPDEFIFVSEYQKRNVESLNIKSHVIEYPISVKLRKNREEGLKFLGLDPNKKHVFHVGLFTPRKNQKEFINYARAMEDENVQFHCIGNMADNFKFYWEPLLNNLPKNVKVWGERKDVDNFYSCMDLFLFTSRGHSTDKETAPIVIKESISFNVPSLLYNLPVYLNCYDEFKNISYLNENSFEKNIELIRSKLKGETKEVEKVANQNNYKTAVVISTYPNHKIIEEVTLKSIQQIKKLGYKVILTSHYPVNVGLQNNVDHYIYDKNNPILKHNFYSIWTSNNDMFNAKVNFKECDGNDYHGLAVALNYQNGISFAKNLGFENVICFNYDLNIHELDFDKIKFVEKTLENKKGFFFHEKAAEGDTLKTVFFAIKTDYFLRKFKYYSSDDYNTIVNQNNCSNGLEQFYFNILKNNIDDLHIDYTNNEESFFKNSKYNLFSMVEYLTVLPNKTDNEFVLFTVTSNKIDDRINKFIVKENKNIVYEKSFDIKSAGVNFVTFKFEPNKTYDIENLLLDENNKIIKKYIKSFSSLNDIDINGYIDFKK